MGYLFENINRANHGIILFDGVCNLCNISVNFITTRNKKNFFQFIPFQSELGNTICDIFNISPQKINSLVLIEKGNVYSKSTAVLKIFRKLSGLWPALFIFYFTPPIIRDSIYNMIAKNRYRWFGKISVCEIPKDLSIEKHPVS